MRSEMLPPPVPCPGTSIFSRPSSPPTAKGLPRRRRRRSSSSQHSRTSTRSTSPPTQPSTDSSSARDGLPYVTLTRTGFKPATVDSLVQDLTSTSFPFQISSATRILCDQWRWGQYRTAEHQLHHWGTTLGWASEYALGDAAEPYLDKALREPWVSEDMVPGVSVIPDVTYGFTGAALTAEQNAVVEGMAAGTRVFEEGKEPLFPFLVQRWVDDGGSRREAEREVWAAGVMAGRALVRFWEGVGVQEWDGEDTVVFSAVVSPEVGRVFVHWQQRKGEKGRLVNEMDQVCVALMEDMVQVEKMRNVFARIKHWALEERLKRVRKVLDIELETGDQLAMAMSAVHKAILRGEDKDFVLFANGSKDVAGASGDEVEDTVDNVEDTVGSKEDMDVDSGQSTPKASVLEPHRSVSPDVPTDAVAVSGG